MKIDERTQGLGGAGSTQSGREAERVDGRKTADGSESARGSQPDRAELSDLAGKIAHVVGSEAQGRTQRVEKLRAAVAAGTYSVDAQALSRALVTETLAEGAEAPKDDQA